MRLRPRTPEQIAEAARHKDAVDLGAKVKFFDDRYWWTVQAVTEHFAALTRHQDFTKDGVFYTVIDWNKGIRGPCDLVGQGWGDGTYTQDECAQMLQEFEHGLEMPGIFEARRAAGDPGPWPYEATLEISHRNRVPVEIVEIKS